MQPFDLERFKAGEPAYDKKNDNEYFYLAEMPDGGIAKKYFNCNEWGCNSSSIQGLNDGYYMKEKELTWDEVWKMSDKTPLMSLRTWLERNCEPPKLKNK